MESSFVVPRWEGKQSPLAEPLPPCSVCSSGAGYRQRIEMSVPHRGSSSSSLSSSSSYSPCKMTRFAFCSCGTQRKRGQVETLAKVAMEVCWRFIGYSVCGLPVSEALLVPVSGSSGFTCRNNALVSLSNDVSLEKRRDRESDEMFTGRN